MGMQLWWVWQLRWVWHGHAVKVVWHEHAAKVGVAWACICTQGGCGLQLKRVCRGSFRNVPKVGMMIY